LSFAYLPLWGCKADEPRVVGKHIGHWHCNVNNPRFMSKSNTSRMQVEFGTKKKIGSLYMLTSKH